MTGYGKLILLLLLLAPSASSACTCMFPNLIKSLATDEFAAIIKVNKVRSDTSDPHYDILSIQIIEQFKGRDTSEISVWAGGDANCGLSIPKNSTWLVFAERDHTGRLSFNLCSLHMRLDSLSNPIEKRQQSINRKLEVLRFLKKNNITVDIPYELGFSDDSCLNIFKGMEKTKDGFAVFRLQVSKEKLVTSVQPVKEFSTPDFTDKLSGCLTKRMKLRSGRYPKGELPSSTGFILVLFYYPPENGYQGFVSTYDL